MAEHEIFRVLVVDDDAMMRELLSLLLTREGYAADMAESGEEALQRLQEGSVAPDLVLADLQMPGMSGRAFVDEVRSRWKSLRIITMSGGNSLEEGLGSVDAFLRKPFTMEMLKGLLAKEAFAVAKKGRKESGTAVLDESVYDQLVDSMGTQRLAKLYSLCLNDTKTRICSMREAAHRKDDVTYRRQAHAIKGSCGMVGASELETLAASLEESGLSSSPETAFDDLLRACNRLEGMLVEHKSLVIERTRRNHA